MVPKDATDYGKVQTEGSLKTVNIVVMLKKTEYLQTY